MRIITFEYPDFILGRVTENYHEHIIDFAEEIYKSVHDAKTPFFLHFNDRVVIITTIKVNEEDVRKKNIPNDLRVLEEPSYDPISINSFRFDPADHETISMGVTLDLPKTEKILDYTESCLEKWFDEKYIKNVTSAIMTI